MATAPARPYGFGLSTVIKVEIMKPRAFLGKLLLALFGIVSSLLLLEVAARLLVPPRRTPLDAYYTADERGYTIHRRNLNAMIPEPETNTPVLVQTNREGFVGRDYTIDHPTSTLRLAFLGDSFTEALQVDVTSTFAALLERDLNARSPQINFEVMNFAVGSQGTGEELLRYQQYVRKYRPDVVVYFFFPNDFENNQYYLKYRDRFLSSNPADWQDIPEAQANLNAGRRDLKFRLLQTSRLAQVVDRRVREVPWLADLAVRAGLHDRGVMGASQNGVHPTFFIFHNPLPEAHRTVYKFTRQLLQQAAERAVADGSAFVVAYLPQAEQVDHGLWSALQQELPALREPGWDLRLPNSWLAEQAKEGQWPLVDLTPAFAGHYRQASTTPLYNWRGQYFNGHLNVRGHQLVAQELVKFFTDYLQRSGIITRHFQNITK
ncbi:MAG: SGNH/GDSL hydrolase family protein [Candidatus Magasanikbacteria bacterium]|nr:SGNH/GDSL hydrolase family protein [Candidatus Magasanikbacteria bacterium]